MEKLTEHNFHVWKQKIDLIIAYREVDHVVSERNPYDEGSSEHKRWVRSDKVALPVIGLSLSDDMLEHVRGLETAKEMLESIVNVFNRHTLLDKLRSRRDFYTATMKTGEKMLTYINRIRHFSTILKSMNVLIEDDEVAMAVLNGLPAKYGNIITALDALGDNSTFTLEFVKSRLLQEEQRNSMRVDVKVETALVHRPPRIFPTCTHCARRGHTQDRCWDKYPAQRPDHIKLKHDTPTPPTRALAVDQAVEKPKPTNKDDKVVCFMTRSPVSQSPAYSFTGDTGFPKSLIWYIDSGASSHMTSNRDVFSTYEDVDPFSVQIGDKSLLKVSGRGDIAVTVDMRGLTQKCVLKNVLHVPDLKYSLLSVGTLISRGLQVVFDTSGVSVRQSSK